MINREGFSLFLEGSGPGERAQRERQRAGEAAFDAAREAWSGRLLGPRITAVDVETVLGTPDRHDVMTLGYLLPHRPDYLYTFAFDPHTGLLIESGYRRAGPPREGLDTPHGPSETLAYLTHLRVIGVTATEIRSWLGEPEDRCGWWPIEIWCYPGELSIELRHGVVE